MHLREVRKFRHNRWDHGRLKRTCCRDDAGGLDNTVRGLDPEPAPAFTPYGFEALTVFAGSDAALQLIRQAGAPLQSDGDVAR